VKLIFIAYNVSLHAPAIWQDCSLSQGKTEYARLATQISEIDKKFREIMSLYKELENILATSLATEKAAIE